jgi:cardiolipin synthase
MALVPVFIIAVVDGRPGQALAIFLVAGLTDTLDGLVARFYHQQSRLGAYLDPVADKLLLISAYTALALPGVAPGMKIPTWVAVLVIARDLLIVIVSLILYLALGVTRFPPTAISKVTTGVQVVAVVLVLGAGTLPALELPAAFFVYLAAGLTVASGLYYIVRTNRMAAAARDGGG